MCVNVYYTHNAVNEGHTIPEHTEDDVIVAEFACGLLVHIENTGSQHTEFPLK